MDAPPPVAVAHETAAAPGQAAPPARPADDERDAWAVLASVRGLGPVTFARLLGQFGSAAGIIRTTESPGGEAAFLAAESPVRNRAGMDGPELFRRIVTAAGERRAFLDRLRELDLAVLTLSDPWYPARLRAIEMPPPTLFVRGDVSSLSLEGAVAVVGTRRPSDEGRRLASRIAAAIARQGASVVSGLAVGIDGAAHAAVVAERGRTVAVLGGGHARIYPRAHARLADVIVAEGGAIVSELAPDVEPTAGTFPRRNRLISGLSDATVVVEAAARSGALITAGWALEQGRPCFLAPGSIDAPQSAGCLAFLREFHGEARIVAGIGELIEDLGLSASVGAPRGRHAGGAGDGGDAGRGVYADLGATEAVIAQALVAGRATVDELVAVSDLPVATVLGALTLLEMRGLVSAAYGRYVPAGRLASVEPARRPAAASRPPSASRHPVASRSR